MDTLTTTVTTRELRAGLSDVVSRAAFGHERIGINRNGKLAAVVVPVEDLEALEYFEEAHDVIAYDEAKAEDDGTRISFEDARALLDELD
ncbi:MULTISPECIES: type II toxin-antitoxin system Phd/YefM family antitoxin [unclassified Actinomyces]|uniref:type II toxin-antitoxin system Phd/YefM family antitoxin n=1 Tax=unclassified Actinomyces TaxID=2609248 RepID=UPI002016D18F|nr:MULTISPECIES: type II toxin-antitoxin system Phd/YefM family antitoxin [unclassified Actinomyces]MCL3778220.1 type II toxin-antitoxin system Phd/YefM family antitoxin [Actinomyces sp. AC-20-1]MCL3789123.1 type II toxin-antitoxin system Phd/YefM family antitoxin [Actinomyces sp. 187325]MCL3791478.1 type II toxin-antitoxin system Phd/YefM family antitoxin [Actinomyces sp. 186855]MCL3794068.1 type II toxin-antitoxin system Phd/YefM family antitoxin [Actinomyces sp. 217892]